MMVLVMLIRLVAIKYLPKVISVIKDASPKTFLVGFKLLDGVCDEKLIYVGRELMKKNNCDVVVANDLSNIRKISNLLLKNEKIS